MTQFKTVCLGCSLAFGILLGGSSIGESHTGLVDGYGCHRGSDKVSYHCHQGQFAGRTFKSKDDFLRELRGGGKFAAISSQREFAAAAEKARKIATAKQFAPTLP